MSIKDVQAPERVDLSDIDAFWLGPLQRRSEVFAQLRAQPGLPFYAEPDFGIVAPGPGYYAVTRLDDLVEASRAPGLFSSGAGIMVYDTLPEFREFFGSMIQMDDPRHARLRRIVSRGFTRRRIEALGGDVAAAAARIVDGIAETGECDAVADIAAALPLRIICDMLGIPESQYGFVFDRSNVVLAGQDPDYVGEDRYGTLQRAATDLSELITDLARSRSEHPGGDLVSVLVNAEIDGERLTAHELASFFILLVVAGNETTRNAITWGIKALTDNPEQRQIWLADPDGVTPTAVEEIVRWASPVIYMRRTVTEPTVLSGQPLAAGDKVVLFYWSANRDEAHFTDPERFDVRRAPNPHVGFGGTGPHFCLGAHLARLEITVMFKELLRRLPDIHATAEPQRLANNFVNGIKRMPVAFSPAR